MKKYAKIIGIILLCLIIIWIIFVTIDCIRLGDILNGTWKKEPFITIATREYQDEYGYGIEYIGLGYLVDYYQPNYSMGYKTTVNLFYKIPINGYEVQ